MRPGGQRRGLESAAIEPWKPPLLRDLIRALGIAVKKAAPPGTRQYEALRRASWLVPRALRGNYEDDPIAEHLHRFAQRHTDVFFVQVGAHDALAGDPISLYVQRDGWAGILVEPVPELFARLQRRYENRTDLVFENAAIAEQDGRRTFYRLSREASGVYELADQLGSLKREVILSHVEQIPDIQQYLEEIEVACVSFGTLLERHSVDRVDVLHLDAEGYDATLLRSFPWERFSPGVVLYEHKHLAEAEREACEKMLGALGYGLTRSVANTLAERP